MNTKSFKIADLIVSRHNVRANVPHDPAVVQALADNITAIHPDGQLIHPITVQDVDGRGEVVAGRNRMLALQFLIEDGRLPEDATTVCNVVTTDAEAALVSQSENVMVQKMHPLDECRGFQKLIAEKHSIEAVALAFGVTTRYVEGRLRLANVAPELLASYQSKDSPNIEQIMALALTDDHAKQLQVWNSLSSWGRSPAAIRRALAGDGTIDATTDSRTKLVSVAEYEAAGGRVQASLLTDHTYLLDAELFDRLVREKLDALAAGVQAEGWSWVEVVTSDAYSLLNKLGVTRPAPRELTADEQAKLDELNAKAQEAATAYHDIDPDDENYSEAQEEQLSEAMEQAEQALQSYQESFEVFTAEQKAFAGAAVFLNHDGEVEVRRGLVRREDRQAMDEATRQGRVAGGVVGGRTTGDAGRPAEAMSAALKDDLHGLRIIAVQNELAKNARVAKVLLALWAVDELRDSFDYNPLPIDLNIGNGTTLRCRLTALGAPVKAAHEAQAEAFDAMVSSLPADRAECWDALAAMTDQELDAIIGAAVALAAAPAAEHDGVTGRLLDALNFNMADHFTVTEDTFAGRVSKPILLGAMREAGIAEDEANLSGMKKGELAKAAVARFAGIRWVPELIRTPAREGVEVKAKKPAAKKPASKKK